MKQLKQVVLRPLTDFWSLNLNIASVTEVDLTGVDKDKVIEALAKIASITAAAPRAISASSLGDGTYVNSQIKGSQDKKKIFTFPEPNPICIYYNSANQHLQQSLSLKIRFYKEEISLDTNYNYDNFVEYFQCTSEGIILLSSTIEGFINQLLPESLEIEIAGSKKSKAEIEWLDITTKIRSVIPFLTGKDFYSTNSKDYENISLIINLRNDLIHLKRTVKENMTSYQILFKRLIDFQHFECSESVFTFINTVVPDFLIERK